MARKVIKYRLNADGTIPDFLNTDPNVDGVGGVYVNADGAEPAPRDFSMVGISVDNPVGDFEEIASQADLEAYLTQIGAGWTEQDPNNPNDPEAKVPFDPAKHAAYVWNKLTALNNG